MNQWVFLGLFIEIWVRDYLQEQKWYSDVVSANPPIMSDSTQKLETRSTLKRQLSKGKGVLVQVGLCSFLGILTSLCFVQAHGLVCPWFSAVFTFYIVREGGRDLVNLVSFRKFLKLMFSCLLSVPLAFHYPLEWFVVSPPCKHSALNIFIQDRRF